MPSICNASPQTRSPRPCMLSMKRTAGMAVLMTWPFSKCKHRKEAEHTCHGVPAAKLKPEEDAKADNETLRKVCDQSKQLRPICSRNHFSGSLIKTFGKVPTCPSSPSRAPSSPSSYLIIGVAAMLILSELTNASGDRATYTPSAKSHRGHSTRDH